MLRGLEYESKMREVYGSETYTEEAKVARPRRTVVSCMVSARSCYCEADGSWYRSKEWYVLLEKLYDFEVMVKNEYISRGDLCVLCRTRILLSKGQEGSPHGDNDSTGSTRSPSSSAAH